MSGVVLSVGWIVISVGVAVDCSIVSISHTGISRSDSRSSGLAVQFISNRYGYWYKCRFVVGRYSCEPGPCCRRMILNRTLRLGYRIQSYVVLVPSLRSVSQAHSLPSSVAYLHSVCKVGSLLAAPSAG